MSTPKINKISIRMYRIGTGDCLLLKFFSEEIVQFKMMIDCGACVGNSERFTAFIKEIGADIDNHLDLLVVSHEHLDHIIGFSRAKDEFEKISIDNVWLAWTEDPKNRLANKLRSDYGKHKVALATAIQKMEELVSDADYLVSLKEEYNGNLVVEGKKKFLDGLHEQWELYHEKEHILLVAEGKISELQRAMDFVKEIHMRSGNPPHYCYPGTKVPHYPQLNGINFYILGPPENEALLKKDEINDELYDHRLEFDDSYNFIRALTEDLENRRTNSPFSTDTFYEEGLKKDSKKNFKKKYLDNPENLWRSIEYDWLTNAGDLAIRLERFMNNTSLAFAIEFEESEKVLLFPGDAQSGNWVGWHDKDLKWEKKKGNSTITITAKDLLSKTVFYKVGHHLSHNGTASVKGLDMMNHPDLIAFATLDYGNIKPGWKNTMPAPRLFEQLIKKTKGKMFRIDQGLITDFNAVEERNKMNSYEMEIFEKSYKVTESYVEININS
ncbi:hypothetical protein QNI16_00105 [Cytophagaceae bacterium YF14B1]|uniref:Metallo-beta-lactamase domain-containing protein n=1 Tax=Xanthocytophaga flava TaxID=3048013 RepID=A0AAE3QHF2_9BACT|nr:hypothetical protein [Xanthocytophaga flavus]MDJ1478860.1 hypothetical protein [Xanthocytophaga flavus]